jgi:hypothetical protein
VTGSALSRLMEKGRTVTLDELAQMWADFHRTRDRSCAPASPSSTR